MNFNTAVPALVNCAMPRRWLSSQYAAVASQNLTCPVVKVADPALTAAVNVTTLPAATDVTGAPAEVTVRVVDVVVCAAATVSASCVD